MGFNIYQFVYTTVYKEFTRLYILNSKQYVAI